MRYSLVGITVRKTHVGRGVFATQSFKRSAVIGQMRGRIVDDGDFDPDYAVDLGDFGALDPSAPFRYLNHSCVPNAELVMEEPADGEQPIMWVQARRRIQPGEQVTIDYAWPAADAIRCLCGTPKCRGWIVDAVELHKLQRQSGIFPAASVVVLRGSGNTR